MGLWYTEKVRGEEHMDMGPILNVYIHAASNLAITSDCMARFEHHGFAWPGPNIHGFAWKGADHHDIVFLFAPPQIQVAP